MKKSAIDRAIERLEQQTKESEARTAAFKVAIESLRAEATQRVSRARKPKLVVEKAGDQ